MGVTGEETAETPEQALELYRKGVEAGERALGSESFNEYAGHFWGHLETRPYMRARAVVWPDACGLWENTIPLSVIITPC